MTTQKKVLPKNVKPKHNIQLPAEVIGHPDLDVYCIVVFSYMKLRYQYFNGFLKTTYHESNSTIAEAVGISRRKVIDCIDKLEKAGFVTKQVRNKAGSSKTEQTNIYTVKDCLKGTKIENTLKDLQWEDCPF